MTPAIDSVTSQRRLLWLLAPATFFQGYDGLILGLALPLIRRDLHLSVAGAGAMVSIVAAGSFGVLVLLPLADRFGRRPLLTFTILGYTLATFATGLSRGLVDFVVYQFIARIFMGAEYALATIVLVELLPEQRRGRALGLVSSMSAFGMAGAGVGFLVVNATGASWRLLYLVGVAPLLLVAGLRRALPETVRVGDGRRLSAGRVRDLLTLPGVRARWLGGASALVFLFAIFPSAVTTFASLLILDEWKWNLRTIDPLYVAVWITCVTGYFVAGRLLDTWGRKPTTVAFLGSAAVFGLVAFRMTSTPGRVLGLGLVIFSLTGASPCIAAFTTEPFPSAARARVGTVLRLADILGGAAAPAVTGILAAAIGGVGPALSIVGLSCGIAALVVVATLPETRGLHVEPSRPAPEVPSTT